MKEFILISHSFNGTLPSSKICEILSERIKFHFKIADEVSIPVADGG